MTETVWLQNESMIVGITPAYGARVTHLVDKRTGRDWAAPGAPSENVGEDADYLSAEARGWDECFPTVARCTAGAPWNRRLRDHGDLWGRPWRTLSRSATALATQYDDLLFTFARRLALDRRGLSVSYELHNTSAVPMPFLWSMHLLLAVRPGDRIDLGEIQSVEVGYLSQAGREAHLPSLAWPDADAQIGFPLDVVQPATRKFAAKLYLKRTPLRSARVEGADCGLLIAWSEPWDSVGIWLNYGGWPTLGNTHHIAIEPTTRPTDIISSKMDSPVLQPGESIRWRAHLSFDPAAVVLERGERQ